jgi:hypothetical protein
MTKSILYVGADDSNHAGDSKGEIILATFSPYHQDSIVQRWPNKRDDYELREWMTILEHDFRFTLLTQTRYRYRHDNLVTVVPTLVREYLKSLETKPKGLKLYFDGTLEKIGKDALRNEFRDFHNFVVANFIKKLQTPQGFRKGPLCPKLVYIADILAHNLYHEPVDKILNHEKFVPLA